MLNLNYNVSNKINLKKGVVYTPDYIVNNMLDLIKYNGNKILNKHIIDNSCGDGSFLIQIVQRFINQCRKYNFTEKKIIRLLSEYIHGIEIDTNSYNECLNKLNNLLKNNNIFLPVKWDIICADSLQVKKFNKKMDFVIGNPPYIRIHDLNCKYKDFNFSKKGMTDLYIIFYEIGLNMLSEKGKLIYITPNSYFTTLAGSTLRNYIYSTNKLNTIVNLRHFNPFENVNTYTAITILSNRQSKNIDYFEYNSVFKKPEFISKLSYRDFYINGQFYFNKKVNLLRFKKIMETPINDDFFVKNGVSSNLDAFFFNKNYTGKYIKNALKISRLEKTKVIYPYDKTGKLIPLSEIKKNDFNLYRLLIENKNKLLKRDLQEQEWYAFARTQGILDVFKKKIVISNIIKDIDTIKIAFVNSGTVVYSGYYIISNVYSYVDIVKYIKHSDFLDFLKILGKDKNGEYYFYSSLDLKKYLSFKINEKGKNKC